MQLSLGNRGKRLRRDKNLLWCESFVKFMGKKIGYIYLSLCILLWAAIPVVSKNILVEMDFIQMLFYSSLISFFTLLILFIFHRKNVESYGKNDYAYLVLLGFLGAYLYYVFLYSAFSLTTAQEGFILAYTWPILVLLLAFILLKERISLRKIVAIILSFFGIIIIITHGNLAELEFTNLFGDILALIGAFVFALFSILGKRVNYDRILAALVYFLVALVFSFITMLLFSTFVLPTSLTLIYLLLNGVLVNGLTYVWWFKALENIETHIVSTALYLTPFVSLLYISIFLSEQIMMSSIIGLIIIVAGIFLQIIRK